MMRLLVVMKIWDVGMKGWQDQWDQALSRLKAAAPATFLPRMLS